MTQNFYSLFPKNKISQLSLGKMQTGVVERIRTYGLVRTKFWENHSRNAIGDDRFYWDMLISPDKVLKSGQS